MHISDIDDLPFHQTPTPFHVAATSDVHFNDGYYHAILGEDWYLSVGLRLHPNTNVMDGFACLARGGEQRCVRVSRILRPAHDTLGVGPLQLRLLEPMKRLSLTLGATDIGLSFTLELQAQAAPFVEARYEHRRSGILLNDLMRYTQVCRATGEITLDGTRVAVTRWHAIRDHSWGVRASMGPRTPRGGKPQPEERDRRRLRLWVPFEVEGHTGFFNTHEDEFGKTLDFEGALAPADGEPIPLEAVRHRLEYKPGTTQVLRGEFELKDAGGGWHAYRLECAGTPADVQGGGYYGGWRDGLAPGVFRGEGPVVETERYPSPPPTPRPGRMVPTEFPCRLTGPGGRTGMAHFEHHVFGAYKPYGFGRQPNLP